MEKSSFIRTVVVLTCWAWSVSVSLLHGEQVLRLVPVEDTYCVNNSSIHGMEPTMQVSHNQYGEWQRVAYLKFDISSIPSQVDSVVMRLYTDGWSAGDTKQHIFRLFTVIRNDWAEDDVSYTNQAAKLGGLVDSPVLAAASPVGEGEAFGPAWIEWKDANLTTYVQDSVAVGKHYLSFRLREVNIVKTSADKTSVVHFHSKENTSGFAPELIVYAPDSAKPLNPDTIPTIHDSAEARLAAIYLDGEPLEFFNPDKTEYHVCLPYSTIAHPVLTAICMDTTASYVVADNMVTCTSLDGQHQQTYSLTYEILPKMDLFLAIGQSNMSGRAPYDDATEPMEDIYLLTPEGGMEISSNPMNKYSNIRKDLSVQGMGPHYQFALALRDSLPEATIGMVVNALGGSSITAWYKPGKSLYDATVLRAKKALKWGDFKGVIWHQGSTDRTQAAADNYATYKSELAALATNLRADLNNDTLWFIAGELKWKTENEAFNQQVIQTIADYIPYADYVISEGTTMLSDNTHFDEASVKLMGQRYADKILEHVYVQRTKDPSTKYEGTMYDVQRDKVLSVEDGIVYIVVEGKKMNLLGQPKY